MMKRQMCWLLAAVFLAGLFAAVAPAAAADTVYEVVWPLSKSGIKAIPLAKRIENFKGKTICEIWNDAYAGQLTFPIMEQEFSKRWPGVKFVNYSEFGNPYGLEANQVLKDLPAKLKKFKCDAVISGNGG
jgi:hypothetical protein